MVILTARLLYSTVLSVHVNSVMAAVFGSNAKGACMDMIRVVDMYNKLVSTVTAVRCITVGKTRKLRQQQGTWL